MFIKLSEFYLIIPVIKSTDFWHLQSKKFFSIDSFPILHYTKIEQVVQWILWILQIALVHLAFKMSAKNWESDFKALFEESRDQF